MKRARAICYFVLALIPLFSSQVFAVEVAPRISDREIIESLAELKAGQKALQQRFDDVNKRIDDLKESTHQQINDLKESTHQQINDLKESNNTRFDDMNRRFDILQWMLGLFITAALVILGFVLRMQWQMHKKQTQIETSLETQKDELTFLKTLIEKLLPPRGVL
ncbi:MAG: hypothetical protein A2889_04730 [Nitrospinae bacterium RIFCSPLOWO2_01_FULL_39_10]|nr:MAG: hypothetical protein A2889_04730 [Nitrospinae bacterium RIFCSPLOWO2_01_FULL_39_10]